MRACLLPIAVLCLPTAFLRAGPYVTVSSGAATVQTWVIGTENLRRESVSLGYGFTDPLAVEVSFFRIADASGDTGPSPGTHSDTFFTEKLRGIAIGPVLRARLAEGLTIFLKASYTSLRDDVSSMTEGVYAQYWSHSLTTISGWQPAVGLSFRLSKRVPLGLGAEMNQVFMSNDRVKELRSVLLDLSYGF